MILTCPSCATQYAVKDGAIPEAGRKVRCASCGHSWHQEPPGGTASEPEEASAAPPPPPPPPRHDPEPPEQSSGSERDFGFDITASNPHQPDPQGAALADPPTSVPVPPPDVGADEQDWDPEKEIPDEQEIAAVRSESRSDRKRNWLMGAFIAIGLVVLIVLALWLIAPDSLRQQVGFAAAGPTPLQIAADDPERQPLQSGNELVVVSGRVINPSDEPQQVPPIVAQLHDSEGRLIHSWTIPPPARTLPPGGSAAFNSAEMDVPPSGVGSTVTLALRS
jgi:predicted Zn finger-like uncharacterized protein